MLQAARQDNHLDQIQMAAQDRRSNGRLLGRVKNAFTTPKSSDDPLDSSTDKPRRPRRRPSLRVSFLERRRSSLIGVHPPKPETKLETPSNQPTTEPSQKVMRKPRSKRDDTSRVSFLEKNPSSFVEILGTAASDEDATYHLGDVGRDEDMIIAKGFAESLVGIAQLKEMDHAFVLRSNGEWRYSIVVATSKAHTGEDPFIKFLVDDKGHTKEIPLRRWTNLIRLPAKLEEEDNLNSQADLMLSSIAVGGNEEPFAGIRKHKSDPEVLTPSSRTKEVLKDNRRMSESCLPRSSVRLSSRRRHKVYPSSTSASFTSYRIPSDFNLGIRRDSGATIATSRTAATCATKLGSRYRYSDVDIRGSWRLSGVEKEQATSNTQFDIKFNQHAFLAALSSINETSLPL